MSNRLRPIRPALASRVMNSILESPTIRARVSPTTIEEYHRQPERNANGRRTELIRGIVIEKMSRSALHTALATRLYRRILALLPDGFSAWKEEPLTFVDSEPEPDVSVLRGPWSELEKRHASTAELVVEVAVSSVRDDQELASIYAEAGVAEYWIVVAGTRSIEAYRRPEGGRYREMRVYGEGEELAAANVPGLRVAIAELFAGL